MPIVRSVARRRARRWWIAALPLALAACATAYGPAGLNGGYSETRVDANVFRVAFKGNVRLTQAQTDEMALLRAAEVTLQNGYGYFASSGAAPSGSALSLATNVVPVPATTMTITCFVDRPDTTVPIFDARAIVASLGPRHVK